MANFKFQGEDLSKKTIGREDDNKVFDPNKSVKIYIGPAEKEIGIETISFPKNIEVNDPEIEEISLGTYKNLKDKNQYFLLGNLGKEYGKNNSENQNLIYTGKGFYIPENDNINTYLKKDKGEILTDADMNFLEKSVVLMPVKGKSEEDTAIIGFGEKANNNLIITPKDDFLDNYKPLF